VRMGWERLPVRAGMKLRVLPLEKMSWGQGCQSIRYTGLHTPGTIVVDYLGKRLVCQSIVPGIFKQREPGENQIEWWG
jgi:hypothetical protein